MNGIALAGLLVACLVSLSDWRRGMYLTVAVALLQDPIRKIVPGQPPYFILFAGIVYGAALLGAWTAKVPLGPRMIVGWQQNVGGAFKVFVLVVLAQAVHSLLRYGVPMVTILGLISYLAPFVALALAHAFAAKQGSRGVERLLLFYLVGAGLALSTIYLESSGLALPFFGEVGEGIRIHDQGTILKAHSGTFRASEIAAWHAATCSCVVLLLLTHRKVSAPRLIIAFTIVAFIVALGILTGRRKFIVTIAIFCSAYMGLLALFLARARSIAIPAAVIGVLAYFAFMLAADPDAEMAGVVASDATDKEYRLYLQRTSGVFGDVNERFLQLGLAPIMWAYDWFGLLGGGAGIGTQGVQHMTKVGGHIGAAEGGLGKIMLELGLPGLLAVAALMSGFMRHVWRLLGHVGRRSPAHTRLACGLSAILVANLASFSVATQAFGDIFILLFLGICFGTLLAIPRMMEKDAEVARRSMQHPKHVRLYNVAGSSQPGL